MGRLDGKVAIVTGAGQGIGQGCSLAMAKEGAAIAVTGRTESKLRDTCAKLAEFGATSVPIVCDVTDAAQITDMVERTVDQLGGVDILINNAVGGTLVGPLLGITDDQFEEGLRTGPVATLRTMRAVHPLMKARGGGAIINMVTSAAVRWDASDYGGYAATKEAMRALTRAAACEWAPDGIRVLAVAPHALTPALAWWTENFKEEAEAFVKTIPMARIGDPEDDIGRAIVALLSDDMRYLTGATIPLDGGQARWS